MITAPQARPAIARVRWGEAITLASVAALVAGAATLWASWQISPAPVEPILLHAKALLAKFFLGDKPSLGHPWPRSWPARPRCGPAGRYHQHRLSQYSCMPKRSWPSSSWGISHHLGIRGRARGRRGHAVGQLADITSTG